MKLHASTAALALFCSAAHAAVITVNSTNNLNPGQTETNLVMALNRLSDGDAIQFNIPGNGPFYIHTPEAGYPFITNHNVTIDGYSQAGAAPSTNTILATNTARIQIVLDSRVGPGGRTLLGPLANPGYDDSESAILALLGAKNFTLRGISFLSRPTPGLPDDPEIYCLALINDATNAHINGCWFGLDPNGVTVAGGGSAVAGFLGEGGAGASGLVFGTDGDGQNDPAEFNITMAQGIALNLETPNVKVAGNFFNVFPNGTTFLDLSSLTILDGGGIEAIENGAADNMVIGTDGDGRADAEERNVFGPVFYPVRGTVALFWDTATNISFAGNYVGVGIDGRTGVGKNGLQENVSLVDVTSFSSIRIGSNFDGVSDALEGNLIYGLGCQGDQLCAPAKRAFIDFDDSNNDNDGSDAARIVLRGNTLVNNSSQILMQDQNVTIATYYSTVLADSTNNFATTLATNASGTQLLVTVPPPNTNNYPTAIVDFYALDPGESTNNPVQGKTYLGSVIDGSAQDSDAALNRVAFDVANLNLNSTTIVAALVTYSQSRSLGLTTQAGGAVTAIFSNPVTISPVAGPLRIGAFSFAAGNVTFTVSGGRPPYQLQVRANLTTDGWAPTGAPFTTSPVTVPATNASQSFFRVAGQ